MLKEKSFKKVRKIIAILFVFLVLSPIICSMSSSVVYAEINESYLVSDQTMDTSQLDNAIKDNWVIETIGGFIYLVASIIEWLVSGLFYRMTGIDAFPWADKVIFNAVPLLDINFINPSEGSLFKVGNTATAISRVLNSTYYTVFTLAIAFLGVCVGIMALRLVFASIASEKARYKKAITQWLMAIIMLFLSHYLMSFIFFVNEQMVEIATGLLDKSIQKVDSQQVKLNTVTEDDKLKIIDQFIEQVNRDTSVLGYWNTLISPNAGITSKYSTVYHWFQNLAGDELQKDISKLRDSKYLDYAYYLIVDRYYVKKVLPSVYNESDEIWEKLWDATKNLVWDFDGKEVGNYLKDVAYLRSMDEAGISSVTDAKDSINTYVDENRGKAEYLKSILLEVWEKKHFEYGTVTGNDLFTGIGQFFKSAAWTYDTDNNGRIVGWKAGKNNIVGTLLYAIFIIQSLMFFIAYTKRFFYVTILALFAPLVIVFDFFTKTMS